MLSCNDRTSVGSALSSVLDVLVVDGALLLRYVPVQGAFVARRPGRSRVRIGRATLFIAPLVVAFFFFQAEDGIRDDLVTGVQTCALPILSCAPGRQEPARRGERLA